MLYTAASLFNSFLIDGDDAVSRTGHAAIGHFPYGPASKRAFSLLFVSWLQQRTGSS